MLGSGQGQSRLFESIINFRIIYKCGRRRRSNPTEQVLGLTLSNIAWEKTPDPLCDLSSS